MKLPWFKKDKDTTKVFSVKGKFLNEAVGELTGHGLKYIVWSKTGECFIEDVECDSGWVQRVKELDGLYHNIPPTLIESLTDEQCEEFLQVIEAHRNL